jgi:glycosyltransferase involved in cell wall biosynthesis
MLRNNIYFSIKPLLPWSVRVVVRRLFARRKRALAGDTWPIMPGSEKPPSNWPGWPDGKKFALVLTHDVESRAGVAKCRQVMELEQALGYRSSFSFIPQGDYSISRILRNELTRNGFEVSVHDLEHDGKLFRSRKDFSEKATRINGFLKDWNAVGFRSGFMLRNLEWLHDLQLKYDSSTFDTDPFEPQPDGVGTIFPFWVPRPEPPSLHSRHSALGPRLSSFDNGGSNGSRFSSLNHQPSTHNHSNGYVELPYTLPQDSTLFLLFRERSPNIWLQKLDWVAKHGGMALVNVHPDYVRFDGEQPSPRTFPAEFYADLLEYARDRYGDSFWHPLPKDLAAFTAQFKPSVRRTPKRVCMVNYSPYHIDMRVVRYSEALVENGHHVDVCDLQESPDTPKQESIRGVNLFHIQERFGKNEKSQLSFLRPLLRFLVVSSIWLVRRHYRNPYDLIHVHNMPDFLVFAAFVPRLAGAKVILDIHDIVPEFYASKFGVRENALPIRMLKCIERASVGVAHHIIISNHLWLDKVALRTRALDKCSVFINNVDRDIFRPRPRTRNDGRLIVIFPGGLQRHQGLDIAFRAFVRISSEMPHAEFHIYGEGSMKNELVSLADELGLGGKVLFFNPLPVREIAEVMANADIGVVPKRADSFGNEAYSTKIMEFLSLGVPMVVSSTKIDRYYFHHSVVRFFESGNHAALADAALEVLRDDELRERMITNGLAYAEANSWNRRKVHYLRLVDSLTNGNKPDIATEPSDAWSRPPRTPMARDEEKETASAVD